MSRQLQSTEQTRLVTAGSSGAAARRFKAKLVKEGWTTTEDFQLKPGFLYTVVRAISARVNQNYDGWPSHELKKSYKTFLHKPVFVNHENHDPTKARGVVVAARYVENGADRYIEVVQEVDAERFPKLAHEIKTGGLDSVSMGAEAGFTICSYCHNKATDLHDMCDHVRNHKGKTLSKFDRRTGKKEDILVFESCHKISFFELSYVFEPADETAVASKVVVASTARPETPSISQKWYRPRNKNLNDNKRRWMPDVESGDGWEPLEEEKDPFDPRSYTAGKYTKEDFASAGNRKPWESETETDEDSAAEIEIHAMFHTAGGICPPGQPCLNKIPEGEQIIKDSPNNPVNWPDAVGGGAAGGAGNPGGSSGYQGNGKSGRDGLNPAARDFYDQLAKDFPGASLGGYNPTVDQSWDEHHTGDAFDFMTSDLDQGNSIKDRALENGAKHVIWQQKTWLPGGGVQDMIDRGSPTENHYDHVHVNMPTGADYKSPSATAVSSSSAPSAISSQPMMQATPTGLVPAQRAAGKNDDLPPLPGDFHVPDDLGGEKNTSSVEPWMDPEEFIKYHNDYFGQESDPITQSNIRDMSSHSLHNYWQDLEKARGKTPDQQRTERQQSKDKAKELADSLWNTMYPPEEEEGRKAVQNTETVNNLLNNGWQPEHIKYDEDDEPYARYQHPSGWHVTDRGGMYKDIGHAATPDEAHDVINIKSGHDGENKLFGPSEAHGYIENQLRGDPEETGGTLNYLTQNDPRIKRYKPRQASATDDYKLRKAEYGEQADAERGPRPLMENPNLRRWLDQVDQIHCKWAKTADLDINPQNSQRTQRDNTIKTYRRVHDFFDRIGAPNEGGTEGVLDYGAGKGHSGRWGHTYEPHPDVPPGVGNYPSWVDPKDVPEGKFNRVTNIHVLNVVPPEIRHQIVQGIGKALAPGGHAVIVTRSKNDVDSTANKESADEETGDVGGYRVNPGTDQETYQKGFTPDELHQYVAGQLGPGYTVTKLMGKDRLSAPGIHIVKNAAAPEIRASRRTVRSAALKKIARNNVRKRLAWEASSGRGPGRARLGYGEVEAPTVVDTLREEGSAPEDDDDDFEQYVKSPDDLRTPDLSQAGQIDRQQEIQGAPTDTTGGVPGTAEPGAQAPMQPQQPQQQYMTLQIPIPPSAPQVPMQAAPPVAAPMPPQDPGMQDPGMQQGPPQQIAASLLDYFDNYYGRRVANWLDAIEDGRKLNPAEVADYRRQAEKLSTLENGRDLSTTNRNPMKGTANMARSTIASRSEVARAGRRQHFAEGPHTDGSPYGENDQGDHDGDEFITSTPPAVSGDYPTDDTNISNTEHNLVARVKKGRDQLLRDAQALSEFQRRRANETATVVDPTVQTGPEGEALTGTDFISADPNDGVVPTNPKDASLRAFQAFDGWLVQKTGKSSRRHSEATIKKAAAQFSREAGISPQALFPALGIVLREARKSDKQANTKGAKMRKRSNESLDVAAPDGRIDVEAPVENVTSQDAQDSQFDLHDFGNNAGDNIAKPDLSTDQNWAPGEAKTSAIKTAGGLLAMRCAEGMIAAGLEPNSRERKYQLAAEFENMNRGLIQDRVALLERFAAVRQADLRKVASGSSRGAARSPIPAGLGGGTRTAGAGPRMAAHDPSNDSSLFI